MSKIEFSKKTKWSVFTQTASVYVYGRLTYHAIFIISDAPSPVKNISVGTLSKCKVNLTWSAPRRDNGCPLNMYTIYYREIQLKENDTPQWREIRLNNVVQTFSSLSLKCGQQYEFTLTASNDAGESDKSHPLRINISGISRVLITCCLEKLSHGEFIQDGKESTVAREFASSESQSWRH